MIRGPRHAISRSPYRTVSRVPTVRRKVTFQTLRLPPAICYLPRKPSVVSQRTDPRMAWHEWYPFSLWSPAVWRARQDRCCAADQVVMGTESRQWKRSSPERQILEQGQCRNSAVRMISIDSLPAMLPVSKVLSRRCPHWRCGASDYQDTYQVRRFCIPTLCK